jgi:hypothetical protein
VEFCAFHLDRNLLQTCMCVHHIITDCEYFLTVIKLGNALTIHNSNPQPSRAECFNALEPFLLHSRATRHCAHTEGSQRQGTDSFLMPSFYVFDRIKRSVTTDLILVQWLVLFHKSLIERHRCKRNTYDFDPQSPINRGLLSAL